MIDAEIVTAEPIGDRTSQRNRLDHLTMPSGSQVGTGLA